MKQFLPFLLFWAIGGSAGSESASPTNLASLRVYLDGSAEFLVNVNEIKIYGKSAYFSRKIRIACISGCKSPTYFEENVDDAPIGLFRMSDEDDLMVSTWVSGTAYVVRVYQFRDGLIRKVLEKHSLEVPQFSGAESNELTITIVSSVDPGGPGGGGVINRWRWSQDKFLDIRPNNPRR